MKPNARDIAYLAGVALMTGGAACWSLQAAAVALGAALLLTALATLRST
jgi:hypothetical protein